MGRLSAVVDASLGRTDYQYDGLGNLQNCAYPNGVSSYYQYDCLNRLTNLAGAKLLTPLAQYAYTVDASGNRLTASERLLASAYNAHAKTIDRVYAYDDVYRLTGETVNGTATAGAARYGYDPVGNRLSRGSTFPGLGMQSFTFDANDRLNSDTYDPNGNTLVAAGFGQTQADRYDFENRLVRRQTAAGTVSIQYDGEGNRVGKIVTTATNTVVTLFVVDEQNPTGYAQVLEELESVDGAALAVSRVYTYGHTLISQDRRDGPQWQASFYGVDGHNNVRYLTDANGVVTDTYDYDAFGKLIAATGTTPNRYLYSGEQYDADLGLYYLRARYHNPDTGRFWSMDTYEGEGSDPGTLHKYTYCGNNPVNAWDPSGNSILGESQIASTLSVKARFLLAGVNGVTGGLMSSLDTYVARDGQVSAGELGLAFADGYKWGFIFGLAAPILPKFTAGVGGFMAGWGIGSAIYDENSKLALFRALTLGLSASVSYWQLTQGYESYYGMRPVPGRVQNRINVANGETRFTPLTKAGNRWKAGFEHVLQEHFLKPNSKSKFTITPVELKALLQSPEVVNSPAIQHGTGTATHYVRNVNVGRMIGTTKSGHGGCETPWLRVFTDTAGNLLTAFTVPGPRSIWNPGGLYGIEDDDETE